MTSAEEEIRQIDEEIAALQPFANGRTTEALKKMPPWAIETVPLCGDQELQSSVR